MAIPILLWNPIYLKNSRRPGVLAPSLRDKENWANIGFVVIRASVYRVSSGGCSIKLITQRA